MKFLITSLLCFIQGVYTFCPMNYNKLIKYNSNNNNYLCCLSNNNKENILSNAIKVLNSAVSTHTNNKKWNPPIGYVPNRIKKLNNKFKKWNPPIGYIPESLKNKKIVNRIDNQISNQKNPDLLFSNMSSEIVCETINDETDYINIGYIPQAFKNKKIDNQISNINDKTKNIKEQGNKLEETTNILKDILTNKIVIKNINIHTNNITTVTLYRNEDNNSEYIP
tara:strand:+ start:356 stop:1024 length:669 start_codon:yes stop_codon:yes gene_type:complete